MSQAVLITGIGGVVGQGVIQNVRRQFPEVRIVGTNTTLVSNGNHLCDAVYEVYRGDHQEYIDQMNGIVDKEDVSLIIPSTDIESFSLAASNKKLKCDLASSSKSTTEMCLDKFRTYQEFNAVGIPFGSSILLSKYADDFTDFIVKPRTGRGSRGIHRNPTSFDNFDDSYLVQEYLDGPEITTSFYVTKKGTLHGFITFLRELDAGNTSKAEVTFEYDKEVEAIINSMIEKFDFRGSINIQSCVTSKGVVPFEINCRISGTNSIRSHFGFKDVGYVIQEYLYDQAPEKPNIQLGSAMRVHHDVIYPDLSLDKVRNKYDNFYLP